MACELEHRRSLTDLVVVHQVTVGEYLTHRCIGTCPTQCEHMYALQALATCSQMRPPVDISVGGEGSTEGVGAGAARIEYSSSVARA